jgi:chorismate synthase
MLRFQTAGESHGQALVAILSGMPAGLCVDFDCLNRELKRRQGGYGRGGRMKIESDTAQFLSGVRHGRTIGSPITLLISNHDWADWKEALKEEVDKALEARDTAGGTFEVIAHGLPPGLGSSIEWDERLDGLLAQAVMSIQAVEIDGGIEGASRPGSCVHDEIAYDREKSRFTRKSNRAGGLWGPSSKRSS